MFRNYLTIALRNLVRHKLYSVINIAGLAVGLACVLFIILYVRDELSYDKWVPDSDNLYRVELTINPPGRPPMHLAVIPYPMPAAMHDEIPEVTGATRVWSEPMTLTIGERQFTEPVTVVNPNFFQIIKLPLIKGSPSEVFSHPESVVLSESAARKFFGSADPLGRTITDAMGHCADQDTTCRNSTVPLTVTGVMRDVPHNSQLMGDVFLPTTSLANYNWDQEQSWLNQNGWGYVTLAPGADPQAVVSKMAPMLDLALGTPLKTLGISLRGSQAYIPHLTPFTQVHLSRESWEFPMMPAGSRTTVYGVIAIGLLILLVACFNFMNLATARAMLRAREIALRKTLGARRGQLILQFLGESVLMALLALAIALALVEMLLPVFDGFLERPISFHYLGDWPVLLLILAVAVAAGLIGGGYPALVLSAFRPSTVLRTNSSGQAGSGRLRATLVVLQFAVSISLGIAASVVFSQIRFARNIDLGFHRDNVLVIEGAGRVFADGRSSFVQALRSNPGILDLALSSRVPFDTGQSLDSVRIPGQPDTILLNRIPVSPDFTHFYGMHLLAGRELSWTRSQDQISTFPYGSGNPANSGHNILLNESAARRLGFTPQQAIGRSILYNNYPANIAGVVADAKFRGALEPVKASDYVYDPKSPAAVSVRLRPDTIPQTLAFIDKSWREFAPIAAVNRRFLDDSFDMLYRQDQIQGQVFGIFVGLAIFIACLGLFGLAAFTASRRTKEIGVRKVFGARTRDVVLLLLGQVSIPVLIANLIAWPLAGYYLHDWLQGFAYRIALSPLYFLAAAVVALLIAWATVLAHAVRVARAIPIGALRYE
jgi:putative ABC transport system permease protein